MKIIIIIGLIFIVCFILTTLLIKISFLECFIVFSVAIAISFYMEQNKSQAELVKLIKKWF